MKRLFSAAAFFATITLSHATLVVSSWSPLFKGIDQAVGTNFPSTTLTNNGVTFTDFSLQVAHCIRVDLTDPDIQLFATPHAPNLPFCDGGTGETLSLSISNFMLSYKVQVAVDANFYQVCPGGSDPVVEGGPSQNDGLLISTGQVVSVADTIRTASLLFTTNKMPVVALKNVPPGVDTTGIFTAVTGYYPVLTNGVNVWALYNTDFLNAYPDSFIHQAQPRTAYGISKDKTFLYLMTIDGRQPGYSDNALDVETGAWMLLFGAWDAINMDGGGSTAMYRADCSGKPVNVNHSSYIAAYGRERILGNHFGVYAKPLPGFITDVNAVPGDTVATITWTTASPATSQVEYGLTPNYGTLSTLDSNPVTSHSVDLSGLTPGTRYYYRVISSDGVTEYKSECGTPFSTTNNGITGAIFDLNKGWKFSTLNLDGVGWQAPAYDDSGWTPGTGVLWVDASNPGGNPAIQFLPLGTQMPTDPTTSYPFVTYYFRTHFNYTNNVNGAMLTLSNYLDDGAAFYLNGVEINRSFLPNPAFNATVSTGYPCGGGNATCPYLINISGDLITNLHSGDNVLAVEVHNFNTRSPDITFGQGLFFIAPVSGPPPPPFIHDVIATPGETTATITWATLSNSTTRLQYGLTASLGSVTPLNSTPVTNHSVTLTNLLPLTNYYFRALSSVGSSQYTSDGVFSTVQFFAGLVPLTGIWAYQTNDLDGINWQAPGYDESLFVGNGPALLYIETNPDVFPLNTALPAAGAGLPFPTYYFRTHFFFDTNLAGLALVFTNYIDDGAIFYLNGTEIQRVRMPPAPQVISYWDYVAQCPPVNCDAVNSAPDIFRISGDLMTNLVAGADNVLAAEVHQRSADSSDIVFGSAMGLVRALVTETKLQIALSGTTSTISWDGPGFTLQRATGLGGTNTWTDVPGPIKSPYTLTNSLSNTFYRLRN